jgi:hypothetical protein
MPQHSGLASRTFQKNFLRDVILMFFLSVLCGSETGGDFCFNNHMRGKVLMFECSSHRCISTGDWTADFFKKVFFESVILFF